MDIPGKRPLVIAIAGPNGAGKSTFYETQLAGFGLRFVNADNLTRQLDLDPYKAAAAADRVRRELAQMRESFVFETVFSDPVGDKVDFLKSLEVDGFQVVLCYIGISSAEVSDRQRRLRALASAVALSWNRPGRPLGRVPVPFWNWLRCPRGRSAAPW